MSRFVDESEEPDFPPAILSKDAEAPIFTEKLDSDFVVLDAAAPVSSSHRNKPTLTEVQQDKKRQVLSACREHNLATLARLAASEGGLVDDEARRVAWPLLLGFESGEVVGTRDVSHLPRHRDEDQVELDVDRAFVYYPANETREQRQARKTELSNLITWTLRNYPFLCYFQGYHDIIQVLLLVLGADEACHAAARLSLLRIRDFMLPTLAGAEAHLHLIPPILAVADPTLYAHLSSTTQPTPFFALAATLTLYAHVIEEYSDIARLFDFLLAREASISLYLFVVIIQTRKSELLDIDHSEPEMLHAVLSKLPQPLDLDALIQSACTLAAAHPPSSLPFRAWSRISPHSALKTTLPTPFTAVQTLAAAETSFALHAEQIAAHERAQRRIKAVRTTLGRLTSRPAARWSSLAILVAVVAVVLGRAASSPSSPSLLQNLTLWPWRTLLPTSLVSYTAEVWQRFRW